MSEYVPPALQLHLLRFLLVKLVLCHEAGRQGEGDLSGPFNIQRKKPVNPQIKEKSCAATWT